MTVLAWLLILTAADPCAQDTSSWKSLRHGSEEIRYLREGRTLHLAVRNLGRHTTHVDVIWRELGFSGTAKVFDLTANKDEGKVRSGFARKLAPGACAAFRLVLPR